MIPEADEGVVRDDDRFARCWWSAADPLYRDYHDREWGFPVADDRRLFEKLCLEGFQSGLSWLTILRKRENFRRAFRSFDPYAVQEFGEDDVARLLADAGIVRNRRKIEATIANARCAVAVIDDFGSLARFVWRYEPRAEARPGRLTRDALLALATSAESTALSLELKRRGWSMVGPTTAYAFMQAVGLVNDHLEGCDIRPRVETARASFRRP